MSSKKCILCGRCRSVCPVYKAVMKETAAPRAKAIVAQEGKDDRLFYLCTLCGACKDACPLGVDLGIAAHRAGLVAAGLETSSARRMVENLRKCGNPFSEAKDIPFDEIKGPEPLDGDVKEEFPVDGAEEDASA